MDISDADGRKVVRLSGRLDSATAPGFQERAVAECGGCPVTLDLAELSYISSAGLRAIASLRKTGSEIRLVNQTGLVAQVLEISDFETVLG